MEEISTIGLDLAKHAFQVHGVGTSGAVLARRQLRRGEVLAFFSKLSSPCVVGMEACGSAHHWAREIAALGHTVRLMPAAYVKPYAQRGKSDAIDAAAIAEAVSRPTMRFVAIKTQDQQAVLMLHKVRDLLVRQRTMLINAMRGHLTELGIIAARGPGGMKDVIELLHSDQGKLPELARLALHGLADQWRELCAAIAKIEKQIVAWHRSNQASRRLATIPGIGPITASAIAASVPDPTVFRSGRHFAAWLGLSPRLSGTGGKTWLGPITKRGNSYIRRLLVVGATSVIRRAREDNASKAWAAALLKRKPARLVTAALANKTARIAWAVLTHEQAYVAPAIKP